VPLSETNRNSILSTVFHTTISTENRGIVRTYLADSPGNTPVPIRALGSEQEGNGMSSGRNSDGNPRVVSDD
jgi:hypothetical protein